MAVVISPIVRTIRAEGGHPFTELYGIVEFRDANHAPTGEAFDLSAYMRRVEYIYMQPISGALYYQPRVVGGDYPGNAGSGRLTLYYAGSGIVTLNISGLGIQLTSGQTFTVSGVLPLISGLLVRGASGAFNLGIDQVQILSGVAISGVRAYFHALGY